VATKAEIDALFKKGRKVSAVGSLTKLTKGEIRYGRYEKSRKGKFGDLPRFTDLLTGEPFVLPSHAALDLIDWAAGRSYRIECLGEQKASDGINDFVAYDVTEAE
jgi:hypothetical protein